MSRFIPDPYERTVKVPVKFVHGVPQPFHGGPWPPIKDGTIGALILPAWSFKKPQDAALLSLPLTVPILPRGEEVLVGLNPSAHKDELADIGSLRILPNFGGFAKIRLDQELRLTLRGTKKAALESCQCWIPGLGKKANSLNEAYTQLSLHYERHRRSHTGNVFRHLFYRAKDRGWTGKGLRSKQNSRKVPERREARLNTPEDIRIHIKTVPLSILLQLLQVYLRFPEYEMSYTVPFFSFSTLPVWASSVCGP